MTSIRILIVEDEVIIAEDIALRLSDMGYQIVQIVDNVDAAVNYLEQELTDLVLLDISLKGEQTGIDLAEIINSRFKIPFIFLSSHTNQSIVEKAKKVNPAAYLLKPFNDHQVKISIEMGLFNFYGDKKEEKERAENHEMLLKLPNALFLKKDTHYEKVAFSDILWLEAESNYTYIYTKSGKYTYSSVLKKFEDKLPEDPFYRVHRSYIVNLSNVTGFEGNMLIIGKNYIPVNKSCKETVFKRFQII